MNKTVYHQLDSKWSDLPYPTKNSTFGGNGCGCCACTHIAIEQPWKADYTPNTLRPWMVKKGFAVVNKGTLWSGIRDTLKYLGHSDVVWIHKEDPMSKAWKELNKGNRIGVLLVSDGKTPDGTYWTASGHYVAFLKYKVEKGKHWFYIKDSGGRNHTGWYAYETSLKGALPQMWIVKKIFTPTTKYRPSTTYTAALPVKAVKKGCKNSTRVKRVQRFLNWCINAKLDVDGVAGEQTDRAIRIFQKTWKKTYGLSVDGVFGAGSIAAAKKLVKKYKSPTMQEKICAKAKEIADSGKYRYKFYTEAYGRDCPICYPHGGANKGWNCIGYAWATWHHAGIPCRCNCEVLNDMMYEKVLAFDKYEDAYAYATARIGIKDVSIVRNRSNIPLSSLQPGDIIAYFSGGTYVHTAVYVGNGMIADCTSSRSVGIKYGVPSYTNWQIKLAFRYKGK